MLGLANKLVSPGCTGLEVVFRDGYLDSRDVLPLLGGLGQRRDVFMIALVGSRNQVQLGRLDLVGWLEATFV